MTATRRSNGTVVGSGLVPELDAVREAAEVALETRAAGGDMTQVQQALTNAAKAALDAGHALGVVAEAEAAGQATARGRLRKDVLRHIERSARKLRETTAEHETVIAQADELGLAAREIAERAGIAHGTVGAIVRRHRQRIDSGSEDDPSPPLAQEAAPGAAENERPVNGETVVREDASPVSA